MEGNWDPLTNALFKKRQFIYDTILAPQDPNEHDITLLYIYISSVIVADEVLDELKEIA